MLEDSLKAANSKKGRRKNEYFCWWSSFIIEKEIDFSVDKVINKRIFRSHFWFGVISVKRLESLRHSQLMKKILILVGGWLELFGIIPFVITKKTSVQKFLSKWVRFICHFKLMSISERNTNHFDVGIHHLRDKFSNFLRKRD